MLAGYQDYDVIGVGGGFFRADSRVEQTGELCFPGGNYLRVDGAIESGMTTARKVLGNFK